MKNSYQTLLLFVSLFFNVSYASEPLTFIHSPPENASDQRLNYYWQILEAALQSNISEFGDYKIISYGTPMNTLRAVTEVEGGEQGRINIVSRATNIELEKRLLAIPIPLDKGLLGYRLFLIKADLQEKLDKVNTIEDLKAFSIGQAADWTDTKILKQNDFNLVLGNNYQSLFQMLNRQRFDLFSRGAIEIQAEWEANKQKIPDLEIEKSIMLAYPMPRYFFVPRNKKGEAMAKRIEDGLQKMAKSGEFERRYQAYKKLVLSDLDLAGRKVFRLTNTQLSDKALPLDDPFWWDDLSQELSSEH